MILFPFRFLSLLSISIFPKDIGFTTKDTDSFVCKIKHTTKINKPSRRHLTKYQNRRLKNIPDTELIQEMVLSGKSLGCGDGEFFGEYDRKGDETLCICSQRFFFNMNVGCLPCPERQSICDQPGMTAPTTLKGWWREDFTSSNLTAQPFYECPIFSQEVGAEPVSTCMGGNNTVTSCAKGFDTSGPVCATCLAKHALTATGCIDCSASRGETNSVSGAMTGLLSAVMLAYICVVVYFLLRPSLSDDKRHEINETLADAIESGDVKNFLDKENELDIDHFMDLMIAAEIYLTHSECETIFNEIDGGEESDGSISMKELELYFDSQKQHEGRRKSIVMLEGLVAAKDDAEGNKGEIQDQMQNVGTEGSFEEEMTSLELPEISLVDIPGIQLPEGFDNITLPCTKILDLPNFQMDENGTDIKNIILPEFNLGDWPGLELPVGGATTYVDLQQITIPSMPLINFPSFNLSKFIQDIMQDIREKAQLDGKLKYMEELKMIELKPIKVPKVTNPLKDVGGTVMKIKLILGFVQCISIFPKTFRAVEWPENVSSKMIYSIKVNKIYNRN